MGQRVNPGAGTRLANPRLGGGTITLRVDGQRVSTGLARPGAILGCNCACNSSMLLGPRCAVRPFTNVQGSHPARSQTKPPRP